MPLLGEGVARCVDTETSGAGCGGGGRDDGAEALEVFRLPGVDRAVAVGARRPFGSTAYLAPGYLVAVPSHPLHDKVYGSARKPNERAGWDCDPIALVGTVVHAPRGTGVTQIDMCLGVHPLSGRLQFARGLK